MVPKGRRACHHRCIDYRRSRSPAGISRLQSGRRLSWRFSRRNRLSSSRSAVVRPPSLRRALRSDWASQFLIDCGVGSNSRASSLGRTPGMHQFHHLPTELRCVGQSCLGHHGLLERKRSGVHETGSTSLVPATRSVQSATMGRKILVVV
jgi:hypothetical protein